jgi:hypothetical protein
LRSRMLRTRPARVMRRRHNGYSASRYRTRRYRQARPRPRPVDQNRRPQLNNDQNTPEITGYVSRRLVNCHVEERTGSSYTPNDYAGACERTEASARRMVFIEQPVCRVANFINTRKWIGTRTKRNPRTGRMEERRAWFCKKTYRVCCGGVMRAPSPYGR